MQYNQHKQNFENFRIKSLSEHFKSDLDKIFNISLKEPLRRQQLPRIFKLSEFEKKKINYLIKLGQYENVFEIQKPYYNFLYKQTLPGVLVDNWKIRGIQPINGKFIIDIFGAQYMKKTKNMTTDGEQFLYPDIIGQQNKQIDQIDKIITEFLKEGEVERRKKYPLVEKHQTLYEIFGLLFLCKLLYRIYQISEL